MSTPVALKRLKHIVTPLRLDPLLPLLALKTYLRQNVVERPGGYFIAENGFNRRYSDIHLLSPGVRRKIDRTRSNFRLVNRSCGLGFLFNPRCAQSN